MGWPPGRLTTLWEQNREILVGKQRPDYLHAQTAHRERQPGHVGGLGRPHAVPTVIPPPQGHWANTPTVSFMGQDLQAVPGSGPGTAGQPTTSKQV